MACNYESCKLKVGSKMENFQFSGLGYPRMSNPRMSNPKMSNPKISNPKMSNVYPKMSKVISIE